MNKTKLIGHKSVLYLFLLIWFSGTSRVQSQEDAVSSEDDTPIEHNSLDERQQALRKSLHDHLERVTHAELVQEQQDEYKQHAKTQQRQQHSRYDENSSGEAHEEEEEEDDDNDDEHEYNPWQDSFQDQFEDGTYVYGYALPNGVTRFERSFFSEKYKGRVVEGFWTEPRFFGKNTLYELRCYRADYYNGYRPLKVQYLKRPPIVRRDHEPNVNCFH